MLLDDHRIGEDNAKNGRQMRRSLLGVRVKLLTGRCSRCNGAVSSGNSSPANQSVHSRAHIAGVQLSFILVF